MSIINSLVNESLLCVIKVIFIMIGFYWVITTLFNSLNFVIRQVFKKIRGFKKC